MRRVNELKMIQEMISKNIRKEISRLDTTQSKLAKSCKMHPQTLQKKLALSLDFNIRDLCRLSDALGVSFEKLVRLNEEEEDDLRLSKDLVQDIVEEIIHQKRVSKIWKSLTSIKPSKLIELVEEFGGWEKVYHLLLDQMEIRKKAQQDYKKIIENSYKYSEMNKGQSYVDSTWTTSKSN